MANTPLNIKYSETTATPPTLNIGEPAYSYTSNTLFIGSPAGTGAIAVGGSIFVTQQSQIFDTANSASVYANAAFANANAGLAMANAAFANGGKIIKPHLLKSVEGDKSLVRAAPVNILRGDFISPSNLRLVQQ